MYPRDVLPHPRIPTRTIEAFGANTLEVRTEDAFQARSDSDEPGLPAFDEESGLIGIIPDMGLL